MLAFQKCLVSFLDNFTCLTRAMETLLPLKLLASALTTKLVDYQLEVDNNRSEFGNLTFQAYGGQ